ALGYDDLRGVALEVVAAGGGDRARGDEQARPRNVALVDRLLDADVAVAGALGLDVADRGEALLERAPHGEHRARGAVGGRVYEELSVVAAGGGPLALQEDVRVAVDEPGQEGRAAEVDEARAGGQRTGAGGVHLGDPLAADQHLAVAARAGARAVDER